MQNARTRSVALLAIAAGLPAVEALILAALSFRAALGLTPQVTAVWPYDTYHDLRWLLVYHDSWLGFAVGLVAVVVARGVLTAVLIMLAWPDGTAPSLRWLIWRNVRISALVVMIISPWAMLAVAAAGVSLSWYLLASLLPLLLLSPFLQRAGVVRQWWRGLPTIELTGWTLLNFAVLTVAGAVTSSGIGWLVVPAAAVAGAANGLLWQRTVRAAVRPARVRWARVPVAPVAVVGVFVAAFVAQNVIGISAGVRRPWRPPVLSETLPGTVDHAVIVLAGYGSSYAGEPAADRNVERFSYRGLDDQERPLPYAPTDTQQSLQTSAEVLAAHVDALHRRTGRRVALVGQSEGAMVVRTFLEIRRHPAVDTALLFSPLVQPGRAYYPPPGESTGWGVVTGWGLRGIFALASATKQTKDDPDEPFVRSILDNAPFYRNRSLCEVPGVRIVAFLPTVTAAEAPPGEYTRVPVFQIPAFHGGVIGRAVAQDRLVDTLSGEAVSLRRSEYAPFQRLAAGWQAPPLLLSVNPVWRGSDQADPALTGRICESG
ncbi:hypothetical protein [Micromonospora halophytica]|uniref:Alpha/beta hydrolase family protein n=1 Tax=Micromonospora halophytica TaxID=47864 RepID=A0A1C5I022_9ACTN|nr:hypothetical protein [Micromonospora halophytica]SCG51575.1 hypothetical protein GA0070560_10737 [Micromonospora halophytica]